MSSQTVCRLLGKLTFRWINSTSCCSPAIPRDCSAPGDSSSSRGISWNRGNPRLGPYLLVSKPTQGLTSSWTRALEAKSSPTRVFSCARNSPPCRQPLDGAGGSLDGVGCPGGLLPVPFPALLEPRTVSEPETGGAPGAAGVGSGRAGLTELLAASYSVV